MTIIYRRFDVSNPYIIHRYRYEGRSGTNRDGVTMPQKSELQGLQLYHQYLLRRHLMLSLSLIVDGWNPCIT
jgi:hypothetical protein